MFVDSDKNTDTQHLDDEYLNLFGINYVFGACIRSKKWCEAQRAEKDQEKIDDEYPVSSNDSCEDLSITMEDIQTGIDRIDAEECSNRSCERRNKRRANSLRSRFIDAESIYRRKDCLAEELEEDAKDFDERSALMFRKYQLMDELRKRDDDSLMYVALGVGVLTLGSIVFLANR